MNTDRQGLHPVTLIAGLVLATPLVFLTSATNAAEVKVAFTGDQSTASTAIEVLRLIADEDADLLLIQGDLGYSENTARLWNQQLDEQLGVNFPVVAVVGNHEEFEWPLYKQLIAERIARNDELDCQGDIGVKATCTFRGLHITQVAEGIREVTGVATRDGYPKYITETLGNSTSKWRICSWHKNQALMQTGNKADDAGWPIYQACLAAGGIAATAHEHAYSRTHLLSDFKNQVIVHKNDVLEIKPGQSFAFVSGLGGNSIREQVRDDDWWASIYTSSQNANYGALFCTFRDDTADCYFKTIDGAVPDQFTLISQVVPTAVPPDPASPGPTATPATDHISSSSGSAGGLNAALLVLVAWRWRARYL